MSDHQAKFYALYLIALAKVNSLGTRVVDAVEKIDYLQILLESTQGDAKVVSHEHGLALKEFLEVDKACVRFGLNHRMRIKPIKPIKANG